MGQSSKGMDLIVASRSGSDFFMLNSTEHEISTTHKKTLQYRQMKKFLALSLLDVVFIMLIDVKMPTIVGILTFMSRINQVRAQLS